MTQSPESSASLVGEAVEVTQADREVAGAILVMLGNWTKRSAESEILDGKRDDLLTIQMVARHRLAALASIPTLPPSDRGEPNEQRARKVLASIWESDGGEITADCIRRGSDVHGSAFTVRAMLAFATEQLKSRDEERERLREALGEAVAALDVFRNGGDYPDFDAWERKARAAISQESRQ